MRHGSSRHFMHIFASRASHRTSRVTPQSLCPLPLLLLLTPQVARLDAAAGTATVVLLGGAGQRVQTQLRDLRLAAHLERSSSSGASSSAAGSEGSSSGSDGEEEDEGGWEAGDAVSAQSDGSSGSSSDVEEDHMGLGLGDVMEHAR